VQLKHTLQYFIHSGLHIYITVMHVQTHTLLMNCSQWYLKLENSGSKGMDVCCVDLNPKDSSLMELQSPLIPSTLMEFNGESVFSNSNPIPSISIQSLILAPPSQLRAGLSSPVPAAGFSAQSLAAHCYDSTEFTQLSTTSPSCTVVQSSPLYTVPNMSLIH